MSNRKERLKQLTEKARHASPVHTAPNPEVDPISVYTEERKNLISVFKDLGMKNIILKEDATIREMFADSYIEASKALDSPLMHAFRKRYGFFDITADDSLGEVLKKMHKGKK